MFQLLTLLNLKLLDKENPRSLNFLKLKLKLKTTSKEKELDPEKMGILKSKLKLKNQLLLQAAMNS